MSTSANNNKDNANQRSLRYALFYKEFPRIVLEYEKIRNDNSNDDLSKFYEEYAYRVKRNMVRRRTSKVLDMERKAVNELKDHVVRIDTKKLLELVEILNERYQKLLNIIGMDDDIVREFMARPVSRKFAPLLKAISLWVAGDLPDFLSNITGSSIGIKISIDKVRKGLPPEGVLLFNSYNGNKKGRKVFSITAVGGSLSSFRDVMLNTAAWAMAFTSNSPEEYIAKFENRVEMLSSSEFKNWRERSLLANSSRTNLVNILRKWVQGVPIHWLLETIVTFTLKELAFYSHLFYSDPVIVLSSFEKEFVLTGLALTAPPLLEK